MAEVKKGFYWHVHHDRLIEWCHNYGERREYIRTQKPVHERETRLRLFQPVKGDLPQEVIAEFQAYEKAEQAYFKAYQAYYEARQAYDEATWQTFIKARQALDEVLIKNSAVIDALHKAECPNCPWNGDTIFPSA